MKKRVLTFIVLVLLPVACNFPLFNPAHPASNGSALPDAATLTATLQPVESTATETMTPSLQSITATVTETVTPTVTATSSDPAQLLGQPVLTNRLDSGQAFALGSSGYNDDGTSIYVAGGKMVLTSHLASAGWIGWRVTESHLANYYLEVTFLTGICSGLDNYGLVFRAKDFSSGDGYYLGISCDGRFSLVRLESFYPTYLIAWTNSAEIKAGSDQSNRIGVIVDGARYSLYFNGKLIQEVNDGQYMTQTKIGVFISAYEMPEFTVSLDQIDMWAIP